MDDFEIRPILAALPLFAETLGPRQLDHLAAQCRIDYFPAGAFLMTEGDFADAMYAIVEGEVQVTFHDRKGDEHDVAKLGAGDIVGEMAVLTGLRRSATVVAETDVAAIEISKTTLESLFARAPELIDRMGEALAARQAELNRMVADANAAPDIAGRIKRFFGIG
ncbi:MAG TPA: cyclic nucleotide-binding domain-containing protein [Bauldia sp.]|nr:cyclic nucleotide-binding domain-containing protein [Bauldia sp.]